MVITNTAAIALCVIGTSLTFIIPTEAFVGTADSVVVRSSLSSTSLVGVLKAVAAAGTINNNDNNNKHDDETDKGTTVSQRAVGGDLVTKLTSVRNLRPLYAGSNLYRAATFDALTDDDTARLFDGSAFASAASTTTNQRLTTNNNNTREELVAVMDLRNTDEIQKGVQKRTHGSREFYTTTTTTRSSSGRHNATRSRRPIQFVSVPILQNVNRFWEATIATMDSRTQARGWFQTILVGGALDRLAARHLEQGGLPLLYQIMLQTAGDQWLRALTTILQILEEDEETHKKHDDDSSNNNNNTRRRPIIIFHCQKGKDRTGILAMLLQSILCEGNERGAIDTDIIESYAVSGTLLNEFPNTSNNNDDEQQQQQASSSTIDWSYFRGSPAEAMRDTLQWIQQEYGSVTQYLDRISFDHEKRARLRHCCGVVAKIDDDGARVSENNNE